VAGNTIASAEILFEGIGRVRNVRQGPDGYIYVAVDGKGIKRLVPL
jgi:glucose/arabinose dehydrogenase